MKKCNCGQLSFSDELYKFGSEELCAVCYHIKKQQATQIIKLYFSYTDETVYLPLAENLENSDFETAEELIKDWSSKDWGFTEKPAICLSSLEEENLVLNDPEDTFECAEFWKLYAFSELAIVAEWYDRPFDENPSELKFSSYFAEDCMKGEIYSKDFAYFHCNCCGRTICEQNPSNGWMTQYRWQNDEQICLSCYEEQIFDHGIDIEKVQAGELPGMFLNDSEIIEAGYEKYNGTLLAGHGRWSDYCSPEVAKEVILELDKQGLQVVINYQALSIIGNGGYVTLWVKPKTEAQVA